AHPGARGARSETAYGDRRRPEDRQARPFRPRSGSGEKAAGPTWPVDRRFAAQSRGTPAPGGEEAEAERVGARQGDRETGGQGDWETGKRAPISLSPLLLVSLSDLPRRQQLQAVVDRLAGLDRVEAGEDLVQFRLVSGGALNVVGILHQVCQPGGGAIVKRVG